MLCELSIRWAVFSLVSAVLSYYRIWQNRVIINTFCHILSRIPFLVFNNLDPDCHKTNHVIIHISTVSCALVFEIFDSKLTYSGYSNWGLVQPVRWANHKKCEGIFSRHPNCVTLSEPSSRESWNIEGHPGSMSFDRNINLS